MDGKLRYMRQREAWYSTPISTHSIASPRRMQIQRPGRIPSNSSTPYLSNGTDSIHSFSPMNIKPLQSLTKMEQGIDMEIRIYIKYIAMHGTWPGGSSPAQSAIKHTWGRLQRPTDPPTADRWCCGLVLPRVPLSDDFHAKGQRGLTKVSAPRLCRMWAAWPHLFLLMFPPP